MIASLSLGDVVARRATPVDVGPRSPVCARPTARERQVANALFLGHEDRRIAAQLGLELPTVRNYVKYLLDKSGMDTRSELWAFLRAHPRWLDEEEL